MELRLDPLRERTKPSRGDTAPHAISTPDTGTLAALTRGAANVLIGNVYEPSPDNATAWIWDFAGDGDGVELPGVPEDIAADRLQLHGDDPGSTYVWKLGGDEDRAASRDWTVSPPSTRKVGPTAPSATTPIRRRTMPTEAPLPRFPLPRRSPMTPTTPPPIFKPVTAGDDGSVILGDRTSGAGYEEDESREAVVRRSR